MKAETVGRTAAILCVGIMAAGVASLAPYAAVAYVAYAVAKENDDENSGTDSGETSREA